MKTLARLSRHAGVAAVVLVAAVLLGYGLETAQRKFPKIGPLPPVAVPKDNPMSPEKTELGKLLFFDTRLSGDGSISCATCHEPSMGWGDGNELSRGYPGTQHWRNSQTVLNSAYYDKLFWAGEATSLESQANSAVTGNLAGNGDPMMIEERLRQVPDYLRRFKKVFGQEPLYSDALKAIAAYERAVPISRNVPFDRYAKGDKKAISAKAQTGMALFQGKGACIQCHNGPLFSDQDYHNLGVADNPTFKEDPLRQIALRFQHFARGVDEKLYRKAGRDLGLYYTTKQEKDKGRFRTPSLRELKYTPPYMHNGTFASLQEVVDFYDGGGGGEPGKSPLLKPLGLTPEEKEALIAFLESLSGDEIKVDPPALPDYGKLAVEGARP